MAFHTVQPVCIWREFILHGRYLKALCASGLILLLLAIYYKFFAGTLLKKSILKLFIACVFLISTALIYSFEIGTLVIPYRYRGTNLGGDTLFYLTRSLTFTILAGTVLLLKYEKFKILIPFAVMVAFSHILSFFNFKPLYEYRQKQIQGFYLIQELDRLSPPSSTILLPDKYEPFFNMWGDGPRTSVFTDKMKITTTKHNFQYVSQPKFEEYYCQLKQASASFTDAY
jgi:hypothetical protein